MSDVRNDATDLRSSFGIDDKGAFIGKSVSELEEETKKDPLTGLANKKGVHLGVARLINQMEREVDRGSPKKLLILKTDIAFFKPFDDLFSWEDGDKVLVELAGRLAGTDKKPGIIRSDAVVGNYGGDDFIIAELVEDEKGALKTIDRLITEGNQLHHDLGDTYGGRLTDSIKNDKGAVLHAFRDLDNNTPIEELTWEQLGMGNLKVGAVLIDTENLTKLPTDQVKNISDETELEKFWSQSISPMLDFVMNKKTKKIASLKSRGTLVTPKMNIVKQWE